MQEPAAEALSPVAAVPRLGAVLAASGPVILTTFGVGRQSVGWFCSPTSFDPSSAEGPYALENVPGELLFWAVLLLSVVVAGLVLHGSRRAMLTAVAAVGAVLAFGLVTAFLLGPDPCTGQERAVVVPWLLIVCYPVAAMALLLAARSPLPRRPYGIILWAGAVGAAAWAAMFHRCVITYDMNLVGIIYVDTPESPWDGLAWWSGEADVIGLPVVLVALAATARAISSIRWVRVAGTATAVALLLFPLLDVATYASQHSDDFQILFLDSVRWPLLVAAALVASAAWSLRARISWAGTVHLARSMARGHLKGVIPGRAKDIVIAGVIAAASVWLIVSTFTPTR